MSWHSQRKGSILECMTAVTASPKPVYTPQNTQTHAVVFVPRSRVSTGAGHARIPGWAALVLHPNFTLSVCVFRLTFKAQISACNGGSTARGFPSMKNPNMALLGARHVPKSTSEVNASLIAPLVSEFQSPSSAIQGGIQTSRVLSLRDPTSLCLYYMEPGNDTQISEFLLLGLLKEPELQPLIYGLFLFMYLITVLGNLLIILAVIFDPRLHTPMYFFLANLSLVDICFTSSTIPKMLLNIQTKNKVITYECCIMQIYFVLFFAVLDDFLLTVMAYDRYVAICHPLHYTVIMNPRLCGLLVLLSCTMSALHSLLQSLMVLRLSFCTDLAIPHFFCELNKEETTAPPPEVLVAGSPPGASSPQPQQEAGGSLAHWLVLSLRRGSIRLSEDPEVAADDTEAAPLLSHTIAKQQLYSPLEISALAHMAPPTSVQPLGQETFADGMGPGEIHWDSLEKNMCCLKKLEDVTRCTHLRMPTPYSSDQSSGVGAGPQASIIDTNGGRPRCYPREPSRRWVPEEPRRGGKAAARGPSGNNLTRPRGTRVRPEQPGRPHAATNGGESHLGRCGARWMRETDLHFRFRCPHREPQLEPSLCAETWTE
ncbi:Olfactory receptor 7A5 [Galemys pyrenaicus]|uniref:Olfactory receptor 7A5 n=1 Tax=Galemys pyrenaicus TaxID=202257 RepID=A0A8J6DVA1_GALPY|nr:Olfactory receptor 7A5 [Galemys pyrenaicus]